MARDRQMSLCGYTGRMQRQDVPLDDIAFLASIARLVRETRELIGWTMRELAGRAGTSPTMVWRVEHGSATDLGAIVRILAALGLRPTLEIGGRHLDDRRRQRDPVHAAMVASRARSLRQHGWHVRTEVEIEPARGWIDLLGFRDSDRALLLEEVKTAIDDTGAIQRQIGFYAREAVRVANRLAWRPARIVVVLTLLDSVATADRWRANASLLAASFPGRASDLTRWLRDPSSPAPAGWVAVASDPSGRGKLWVPGGRRQATYRDYADCAAALRDRRPASSVEQQARPRADARMPTSRIATGRRVEARILSHR